MTLPYPPTETAPAPTPPRRRWVIPVLAAALLVAATSVATWAVTHRGDGPATLVVVPTPVTAAAPAPTTAAAATSSAPTDLKLGARHASDDGVADATALDYRQPVARDAEPPSPPGTEWGAAKVRVCSYGDIEASEEPWALAYADGGVIKPSYVKYGQFPEPEYPVVGRAVPSGRCVTGWIVFPALKGERPAYVEYAPEGEPVPVRWKV